LFFRQVLHDDLGCASYVIADGGEGAVIDPKWEIEDYLELADEHGFRITHILETHNHADHVSGHGRLAAATGASIHVSADAGARYEHEPLSDGSVINLGNTCISALATPGHRPEHLAFLVNDDARSDNPWLVVTGDSLFVGDLARPDLAVEAEDGAKELFASLRRLLELADYAEVWPGHIGGSLCGGAGMSEKPGSTIGFERRYNRFAAIEGERDFVRELTSKAAPQPPNFKRIVALNTGSLLTDVAPLEALAPARVKQKLAEGAVLVDGRDPREFDAAHVPGSINVTATKGAVGTRAAWVVEPEAEVLLAASTDAEAARVGRLLEAVGFRRLGGYLAGGLPAWQEAGFAIGTTPALDIPALAERMSEGAVALLDVRELDEWEEGHVEGSLHVPYHGLRNGLPAELQTNGKPLAVACSAGNRSSIAASLLKRAGVTDLVHVAEGGIADLEQAGIGLVREEKA
jgi:glyoxylase-like metal-dependent hydrolase (beta-lactamase superfamily II)/rhodanese-related sulfurtransferase